MNAVLRKILADIKRRRLQTVVVFLVVVLASGTATLALTLLLGSTAPYDRAFAQQRGAHVLQEFTGSRVSTAELHATLKLPAISAAAGPWPTNDVTFEPARVPPDQARIAADIGPPKFLLKVVARATPGGSVDVLRMMTGRWLQSGNEIVLTRSLAAAQGISLGDTVVGLVGRNHVRLRVVGEVIDVDEMDAANQNPQHAWVLPRTFPTLVAPGDQQGFEMAYRFQQAATNDELRAALAQLKAVLPVGAMGFTRSYIDVRNNYNITDSLILTFLLAFSVFALGAAALVIANIVAGAVLAGFSEIGVMKAIGFTPAQVVQILIGQMLIPAAAASLMGIPLGVLLARPLLNRSADALGLPAPSAFSLSSILLVVLGEFVIVCVAAGLPALRAGMLSPARAIVAGTAPESRKGRWLMRRFARLHLPQAIRLGAGQAFARPLRAAFTMVAILVGVATITFAFGVRATLIDGMNDPSVNGGNYQIVVNRIGRYSDAHVMRTLRTQRQTVAIVARDWASTTVDGLSQPVQTVFTRGNALSLGLSAKQGRWYAAPGEAVAPAAFLKEAHLQLGDFFNASINGRRMRFHLVGTIFDTSEFGRILHMDFSTLAAAVPGELPSNYLVRLRPGADPQSYAIQVNRTSRDSLDVAVQDNSSSSVIGTVDDVVVVLAIVLAIIALAAVFNTVLLNTRERARETAVLKAMGMSPGQTIMMVVSSAAFLGLLGGILGIPIGVALHSVILQVMANLVGNDVSIVQYHVYSVPILIALFCAGVVVAMLGAYLPGRWTARTSVTEVLRAE